MSAQDDDADDDSATISLTGSGFESGSVEVTVSDDDGTSGLNLSALWPEGERGAAGRVVVRLDDRAANDKLITLMPSALMPDGGDDGMTSGDSSLHSVQSEHHHPDRSNHDGSDYQLDHRRRHPTASA
ncbi:MAG: hypothetical protein ISN29_08230 [Gammaproteobacteria bacterium AqS3]|nr:hypothetical protein [Gammaproteobacteria bacterium AqS3]